MQVDVERSKVWVYDTRTVGGVVTGWVEGDANNHAWAVYDILAQGHPDHPAYPSAGNDDAETSYGCGIDKDRLDYESFRTWAENIGDIEYELNIVFDTFMTAWDAILRICQEGRGMVYPVGTKIFAFTDKATDVTQVFTTGNIHKDTFVQKYLESNQKISMIEANYWDRDRNYEKTMIAVRTANWDSELGLSVPTAITLYGTNTFEQAWSIARFILMGNELLNNITAFDVDVESLASQAGNVIGIQHDVLAGWGGRIVSYEENLCQNPSFETADWPPWTIWNAGGNANKRQIVTNIKYSGAYSYWHRSNFLNSGNQQTITVLPSTTYTLSCFVYIISDYTGSDVIWILTTVDGGGSFPSDGADVGIIGSWQRLSFTVTTGAAQTSLTVWIGGNGNCYFDAVQIEQADAVTDWMNQSRVTLDREITMSSGNEYELIVQREDEILSMAVTLNIPSTANNVEFDSAWPTPPQQLDLYSFGIAGSHAKKYRITDISRTTELMRTLTLVQYDEDLYGSYTPDDAPPEFDEGQMSLSKIVAPRTTVEQVANLLNLASNVQLREALSKNRNTGEYESSIVVTWDTVQGDPRGAWQVWLRDVDASDVDWQGTWVEDEYDQDDKVERDGKTYISLKDGNVSTPFSR